MPKTEETDRETGTVAEKTAAEVYRALHAKVLTIRSRRRMAVADIYQQFGGPGIDREYRKVVAEMSAELGGES